MSNYMHPAKFLIEAMGNSNEKIFRIVHTKFKSIN